MALELERPLRAGSLYTRDRAWTARGLLVLPIPLIALDDVRRGARGMVENDGPCSWGFEADIKRMAIPWRATKNPWPVVGLLLHMAVLDGCASEDSGIDLDPACEDQTGETCQPMGFFSCDPCEQVWYCGHTDDGGVWAPSTIICECVDEEGNYDNEVDGCEPYE